MVFREKLPDGSVLLSGGIPPTMQQIIDALYPVNTIYFSTNNVNPATRLGGTWVAWGSGMVPVGVNAADPAFDVTEKVGGAKDHTLTNEQLPSHRHGLGGHVWAWGAGGGNVHINSDAIAGPAASNNLYTYQGSNDWANTGAVGSGQAHNNLQPYITCYMWKRTA